MKNVYCVKYSVVKVYLDYTIPKKYEEFGEEFEKIARSLIENQMEKFKYKTMWCLRSLENEIDGEGGMIIIKENGKIHTKNFTPELTEKIKALLAKS